MQINDKTADVPRPGHFADRLIERCRATGAPLCVGLDPVYDWLPTPVKAGVDFATDEPAVVHALERFCAGVIKAVAPHVPCVKVQAACFERYRSLGMPAFFRVVEFAREKGLLVIADAKRGDIGLSSEHYAAALLGTPRRPRVDDPDALTINSYMGTDGFEPFLRTAASMGMGLFALVRTSNAGSDAIQALKLADGREVGDAVADIVAELGASHEDYVGEHGYSLLGAVVGATRPEAATALRQRMPQQVFLVPGFGAQGGSAEDVKACFNDDGLGAIVTASRSVIYAFDKEHDEDWIAQVEKAAIRFRDEVAAVVPDARVS